MNRYKLALELLTASPERIKEIIKIEAKKLGHKRKGE